MKTSAVNPPQSNTQLRRSLVTSQRESFASSLMTGSFDQYVNAFAVFLGATSIQIGWLTAMPQLAGGLFQLLAVWLGQWVHRHRLIVVSAAIQTIAIALVLLLTLPWWDQPITVLLIALINFHICANLIMPHWRAWMGQLVPDKIRGRFFSLRTRIAMLTSFITFMSGGLLLSGFEKINLTWLGFLILFSIASLGRGISTFLLARMHDDETLPTLKNRRTLKQMFSHLIGLLEDRDFRRFSVFMAAMQCFVALSGPFFAVYMLRDLHFTYFQFAMSTGSSIFAQFLMLPLWGKICDKKGNRYVMALCGAILPCLPTLWLFSDAFLYIIGVQVVAGISWAGFTLASSNYLYDQKPRHLHFASYAAISSSMGA